MSMTQHRNDLRTAYDKNAQTRDSYLVEEWKSKERSDFLMLLGQNNKKKLLELGAGPGHDSKFFILAFIVLPWKRMTRSIFNLQSLRRELHIVNLEK